MKAVITVLGRDTVGILARVCAVCADYHANVTDVTQTVLGDIFAMLMLADLSDATISVAGLSEKMTQLAKQLDLTILVTHEDVFDSMHRI